MVTVIAALLISGVRRAAILHERGSQRYIHASNGRRYMHLGVIHLFPSFTLAFAIIVSWLETYILDLSRRTAHVES